MRTCWFCFGSSAFWGLLAVVAATHPDLTPRGAFAEESLGPVEAQSRQPDRWKASTPLDGGGEPGMDEEFTLEERISIAVYERVNRSVVNITTRSVRPDATFLFATPMEGSGSGSILDKRGHVLTNNHVVKDAREIRVTLFNGEAMGAELVGQDPQNDIAVLKIVAQPDVLYPVELGDSNRARVGQKIYAIGNPFGLERTMTVGIISSLNRTLQSTGRRTIKSVIQIDAALNQGNSGGPLLDNRGRLIGMNTAIASLTGENTGVGFSIPVNTIRRVVPQLIEKGRVIRPDIGITRVLAADEGLVIVTLAPGGAAEKAGLSGFRLVRRQKSRGPFVYEESYLDHSRADLIVAADGQKVTNVDDFLTVIESKQPGETVVVTVIRQNRRLDIAVVLGVEE